MVSMTTRTFGRWTAAERQMKIYLPNGFARGFLAKSDTDQFLYKCSGLGLSSLVSERSDLPFTKRSGDTTYPCVVATKS